MSMVPPPRPIAEVLGSAARGDACAADALLVTLYGELHRLAEARLRHAAPAQTLQATALVHEAYLRLVDKGERSGMAWESRAQFFFAAARAMRDILVERARRRASRGRAESAQVAEARDAIVLDESTGISRDAELLALEAALRRLAATDERKHAVVMLRYFAGLTLEQAAELLAVNERTVRRDWRFARAWLHEQVAAAARDGGDGAT